MAKLRPLGKANAAQLDRYITLIVEPTFADFGKNRSSVRHAFLACVATFHSVDRATFPKSSGNLRKAWGENSLEFHIVDMVAHHFKHVRSSDERPMPKREGMPLSVAVFGSGAFNTQMFDDAGVETHNLYFVVRDAINFVRKQIGTTIEAHP